MVPSQPRLDVGKLKDEWVAEEFVNRMSGDLGGLGALGDPEELWSAFKTTVLDVAGGCLGAHHRAKKNFVSQGTLDTIDQSRRARLNGRAELFRELRRKTAHVLRVNKEFYVRGICEGGRTSPVVKGFSSCLQRNSRIAFLQAHHSVYCS